MTTDDTLLLEHLPGDDLQAVVESQSAQLLLLEEQIGQLELALEDASWSKLGAVSRGEFSRSGIVKIAELARAMAIKNPLIKRAVETKTNYVWGQGIQIQADHDQINAVLQGFLDDEKNQAELTGQPAQLQKDAELQTDGNLFFVFFVDALTGRVRIRSLRLVEVVDIVTNPDDAKEVWFYKRCWTAKPIDGGQAREQVAYYPDWRYMPIQRPAQLGSIPIRWQTPIYHVKVGGFSDWTFGISELYAALDWARAYKEFLEDVATLMRAYSRFAFKMTTKGGSKAVESTKAKLASKLGTSGATGYDTNPAPVAGSTAILGDGFDLNPVNVRGASVAPDDGRRLLLMVAAAVGLPETFFGDADVGNHATAKTLDRPTELAMLNRQTLWSGVYTAIVWFVVRWSIKALRGPLRGIATVKRERDGAEFAESIVWKTPKDPQTGKPKAPSLTVEFPPILALDIKDRIGAIVSASTLDGKSLAGTIDRRSVSRMLLTSLGVPNVDELLALLDAEQAEAEQKAADQAPAPAGQQTTPDNGQTGDDQAASNQQTTPGASQDDQPAQEAITELRQVVDPILTKYERKAA